MKSLKKKHSENLFVLGKDKYLIKVAYILKC